MGEDFDFDLEFDENGDILIIINEREINQSRHEKLRKIARGKK